MRRLLALALLAPSLLLAPAASAGCDEYGECHPSDCIAWDPLGQAPSAVEEALHGNVVYAVGQLLPPPCP
jgi:hypothetical protein